MSLHARPEHIKVEGDPMFSAWSRLLPRLWYLDQRQATKIDAETLYGSSLYAAFFGRSVGDTLGAISDTATILATGFLRSPTEAIPIGVETASRTANYFRSSSDSVMDPADSAKITKAGSGVVQPPIHEAVPGDI